MDLHQTCHFAQTIAREAGALLRDGLAQPKQIKTKSTAIDWVTQYDEASEHLIKTRLAAALPDHGFVGEETGVTSGDSPFVWYIDPLDGTMNYAHGLPFFSVSLALAHNGRSLLGVVYSPMLDECFYALAGEGAWVMQGGGEKRPLIPSPTTDLQASLLCTGYPHNRRLTGITNLPQTAAFLHAAQGIRRLGSAALELAYVAAGRLDGFWELRLSSWDYAAGVLLVQEAGGCVTQTNGTPYALAGELPLVASNGHIHQQMLAVLAGANS